MSGRRILMEVHEGRIVSALLENGFLQHCIKRGAELHVITPAANIAEFQERYGMDGAVFHHARLQRDLPRMASAERKARGWLTSHEHAVSARALWFAIGERIASSAAVKERELIDSIRPDVVFTPHVAEGFGRGLIAAARRSGIPTVGNVMSWDNPYRPLMAWPDVLTCWSERTRDELAVMCAHPAERAYVIGAPQFDAYFAEDSRWPREELCSRLGLDPARPIVLFATLGQFRPFMDETGTFAAYLDALDRGQIEGRPQTVLRLHPVSRSSYYERLTTRDDVVVSRFTGYIPGMMWSPTRDEIILAGNLLAHADVCISPGSTMTIETAIFDTPTVLPAFNPATGDEYASFFEEVWLQRHFRWIVENHLVPVARTTDELTAMVSNALLDRGWYSEQRARLRNTIVGPLDGCATERLAEIVATAATHQHQAGA